MTRRSFSLSVLCLLTLRASPKGTARASEPDEATKEKIRVAIPLPLIYLQVENAVYYNQVWGFYFESDKPFWSQNLAAIPSLAGLASPEKRAEHYVEIAKVYQSAGKLLQVVTNLRQAAVFFEEAARQKQDRETKIHLSVRHALILIYVSKIESTGDFSVAEKILQQAHSESPQNWEVSIGLSYLRSQQAEWLLWGKAGSDFTDGSVLLQLMESRKPAEAELKKVEELSLEAEKFAVEATKQSPLNSIPWIKKWALSFLRSEIQFAHAFVLDKITSANANAEYTRIFYSDTMLSDLQRAADCSPNDPGIQGMVMTISLQSFFQPGNEGNSVLQNLNAKKRAQKMSEDMTVRMKQIASDTKRDKLSRMHALESLAFTFGTKGESKDFRSIVETALALAPERPLVGDTWLSFSNVSKETVELRAFQERRIKLHDRAFDRLLLAKALFREGQIAQADEQARLVLAKEPENTLASLFVAVFALKQSDKKTDALGEAYRLIVQAKEKQNGTYDENTVNLIFAASGYNALIGDYKSSLDLLDNLLANDKTNEDAQKLRDVIQTAADKK